MANSAWSILVGVELEADAQKIQSQLNKAAKNVKFTVDTSEGQSELDKLGQKAEDVSLTFQAANMIFNKSKEVISSMVEQVFELNSAIVEFQKVSDLTGKSLDNYVSKLSDMGSVVARTGKPKCQAPDDGMVNQHQHPLEIQYNLRAYSATMVA